jgi:hypothetical protein
MIFLEASEIETSSLHWHLPETMHCYPLDVVK